MISKLPEKFLVGALIGCAIGATAALILTPISGERLRKRIAYGLNRSYGIHKPKPPSRKRSHHEVADNKIKRAPRRHPKSAAKKTAHSAGH